MDRLWALFPDPLSFFGGLTLGLGAMAALHYMSNRTNENYDLKKQVAVSNKEQVCM